MTNHAKCGVLATNSLLFFVDLLRTRKRTEAMMAMSCGPDETEKPGRDSALLLRPCLGTKFLKTKVFEILYYTLVLTIP
jgi:hypothetical protein